MEPTTSLERHQARNQIREARRAERDMLEGEEVGDYLSDSQSDDDRHYMDDETRDPSHVPAQISKGCRGDCLNYVRSLAYHQVSNHLVKRVSQAVNDAEAAVEKCERHLKGKSSPKSTPRSELMRMQSCEPMNRASLFLVGFGSRTETHSKRMNLLGRRGRSRSSSSPRTSRK